MPETVKSKKKFIIAAVAIAVSLLLLILLIRGCKKKIGISYEYENISKGEVKKTISITGRLEVLNSYSVLSRINGVVSKVYVDFNQNVSRNQLMAVLDSIDIDQTMMRMAAQLDKAKLDLQEAKQELDARTNLYKDNLISKREMELSELKYRKSLSQYRQIEVDYKVALTNKSYTKVLAPVTGFIISMEAAPNVPAPVNKILFVIAEDLRRMRLIINVDESDIGSIKKGQKAFFNVSAFPEKTFTGEINQVRFNPITKGDIVSYESVVICDNKELLLKPGMTATATVIIGKKDKVLRVLNEAFIVSPVEMKEVPGKKFIWRKQGIAIDLPFKRIEVKTGLVGDFYTEILSGNVKEGDDILIKIRDKIDLKDDGK